MFASQEGRTEALALLLANGANVNAAEQAMQNNFLKAMNLTTIPLKIYPFVELTLLLKLGWADFRYVRFTKWAHSSSCASTSQRGECECF
jgi:hypothetical protein